MDDTTNTETPETGESDSLRDEIASAFEASDAPEAPQAEAPTQDSGESVAKDDADRPRDPNGRFAKKEAEADSHGAVDAEAGAKPVGAKAPSVPTGQPVPAPSPLAKPPASWKPAAREAWAMLPDPVKAEILRREGDTSRVLNETTEARKLRESFQQTIAPYEAMLRAENAEPLKAVQNLLETARMLRQSPPEQRAHLVAQIVQHYGVPIQALDAALAGQPVRPQGPAQYQDPRVDQLMAQIEQAKAQRAQAESEAADREVEEFGTDKEFFDDVRETMADLIEIAEKRGQKLDLETAYKRAVSMDDEISAVIRQREAAKSAATAKAATSKAKAAASSVRTSGPPPKGGPGSESLRDAIAAAFDEAG